MMRTFFIYDSEYCKSEEDDPKDALLYFFPSQKYGNQRYSLCCQIVGVAKFFKATFSSPALIETEQEKFALHWSGNYLIVLGGSLETHRNILKRQLLYLCGLFCFYHGSINNLLNTCRNDRKEFLAKMELSWSRYINFMQRFNNMLQIPINASSVSFVKEHGEVINKSNRLLHMCQMSSSVVAGAVFSNSRVLSSQLTPELSSYLILMSNENAASPVGNVLLPKNLPVGVELKYVYLNRKIIQSIVRYNHAYVGSSVRVKTNGKTLRSHSHYESLSSGSEGDVDSGNCTEICHFKKDPESNVGKSKHFELNFKTQLLCCSMHSTIFKRDLLKSKNKTFMKYINSEYISEKLKMFKRKASTFLNSSAKSKRKQKIRNEIRSNKRVSSVNLPCHHHADILSTSFVFKSTYSHLNLSSTCDLEYSCFFCINHQFSGDLLPPSLKSWNSNMQIPDYLQHISLKPCPLECNIERHRSKKEKSSSKYRIQVLKCRLKSHHCDEACLEHSIEKRVCFENVEEVKSRTSRHQVYRLPQNLFNTERYWDSVDHNKLEKAVLYVQRYDTSVLVLLLSKNYDDKILMYLWNCGFSFLKDLEHQVDNKVEEGLDLMDSMHYILIYDASQTVLKEHPYNHGTMFSEKYLTESIQEIQEDFQSHSKMQMMSILSANHAIYACQNKQQSAFYLQHDQSTQKLESLINLSKRANRRFEKY